MRNPEISGPDKLGTKKHTGYGFFGSCYFALRKTFNLSPEPAVLQTEMIFKPPVLIRTPTEPGKTLMPEAKPLNEAISSISGIIDQ